MNQKIIYMLLLIFLNVPLQARQLINELIVTNNKIVVKPHSEFKKHYLKDDFFVEYQKNLDLTRIDKSILIMPFIMNVIPIIWLSNETWEIDVIDEELFESLNKIKKILTHLYPEAQWNGELKVNKLTKNHVKSEKDNTFAMLFSGGLDSIHTSISNKGFHQILITVREHHGFVENTQWKQATKNVIEFAQRSNYENCFVSSNYTRFLNPKTVNKLFSKVEHWSSGTSHGLGWAGIVAPLLFAYKCTNFKIASGDYPVRTPMCSMLDDNIKFAGISIKNDSFGISRLDKTKTILSFFKTKDYKPQLYVCTRNNDGFNCCQCEKCVRTICCFMALKETSFQQYGFNISLQEAQEQITKYIKLWLSNGTDCLRFAKIQNEIKSRILNGNQVSPYLKWLADLEPKEKFSPFDWDSFANLVLSHLGH